MCVVLIRLLAASGFLASGFAPFAVSVTVELPAVAASTLLMAGPARSASASRMSATDLLADMRSSLAKIATSYRNGTGGPRHRSVVAVLRAVGRAARATEGLEAALGSRDAQAVSTATKTLSKAVGDLQTRYSLCDAKNDQAASGLRRFNAAWKTYASRYVLSNTVQGQGRISQSQVRALRRKVAELSGRVSDLEAQVADNAALRSEIGRMRRDLVYFDARPDNPATYQDMVLTLTFFSGSFDAVVSLTRDYYPKYYRYFQPYHRGDAEWDAYWAGYYDGYYDRADWNWYREAVPIHDPVIQIEQTTIYQSIDYRTIYNITNETVGLYDTLPAEDLSSVAVKPAPADAGFSVAAIASGATGDGTAPPPDRAESVDDAVNDIPLPDAAESRDRAVEKNAAESPIRNEPPVDDRSGTDEPIPPDGPEEPIDVVEPLGERPPAPDPGESQADGGQDAPDAISAPSEADGSPSDDGQSDTVTQ